jgi:hypothetical protein
VFSFLTHPGEDNDGRDDGPEDDSIEERCAHPGCGKDAVSECECCRGSTHFCEDHGSKGDEGDEGSLCWKCGGYNADEEQEGRWEAADDLFTEWAEEGGI